MSLTIGDALKALRQVQPYLLVLGGLLAVLVLAPGEQGDEPASDGLVEVEGTDGTAPAPDGPAAEVAGGTAAGDTAGAAGGTSASTGPADGGEAGSAASPAPGGGNAGPSQEAAENPDCDPATGRIRVPSLYAPACVPVFTGDNGGATYRGVTSDTIKVAVYVAQANPATDALFRGAGATESQEQQRATLRGIVDYFQAHYETYGRQVELVFVEASGAATDDSAAKADAIRVAEEIKAFASWGDPGAAAGSYAYADELAARGVVCLCGYALPQGYYEERAPYMWSYPNSFEEGSVHWAEYIGKRLWNKPARWAGDPLIARETRRIAMIEYDTPDKTYTPGVEFFERELAKYGARLSDKILYNFDLGRAQEQARTTIARLKEKKITTVIMSTDPLYPSFFTAEATRQNYFPEWMVNGAAFTDWTFFARTYDQQQWSHAFGTGYLAARVPRPETESHRLYIWHHGEPPPAPLSAQILFEVPWMFFTGVHGAGPELTPHSYRDGMFRFPRSGGGPTTINRSFGTGLWPWPDYTGNDDQTELWWDVNAVGEDENGNTGKGMYRYVNGGRRYLPGQWPSTEPAAFDPEGTVLTYEELPPEDRPPTYEHQAHR